MTQISELGGSDPTRVVGRRVIAWFIDSMIGFMVIGASLLLMGTSYADISAVAGGGATQLGALETGQLAIAVVMSLLFAVVNRILFVSMYGWTLGKLFVGLRCVNALGRPPGLGAAIVRGVVMYVFESFGGLIGSMLLLLSVLAVKGHRSFADLAAKTFVIDSAFEGRLVILGDRHAIAGPESITRDEAQLLGVDLEH